MTLLYKHVIDTFVKYEKEDIMNTRIIIGNIFIAILLYSFIRLGKPTLTKMQIANLVLLFISFNMFIYEAKE